MILSPVLHVVQDGVPVRERAALGVLAGEPDRDSLDEQRTECESLRLAPVDPAFVDRLEPALQLAHQLRMHREVLRDAQQLIVQLAQPVGRDGRDDPVAAGVRDLSLGWRRCAERRLQRLVGLLQLRS